MPVPANLVHQTSTSTGTGNLTLTAVNGKQAFATAFPAGTSNEFDYFVSNRDAAEWERGTGHVTGGALVRDTVIESTNANAAVSFSAGTKDITNDIPAAKQVTTDTAQSITGVKTLTNPVVGTQTSRDNSTKAASTAYVDAATREKLSADRTYYVRTDGSDSNTGLANSSGGAFLTIQKAVNVTLGTLDLGGYNLSITVIAGTYTGAVTFTSPQVGAGKITITGDTTTPSNVTISTTGAAAITVNGAGCRLFIEGLKLTSATAFACLYAKNGGYVKTTNKNEFGNCNSGYRIVAEGAAVIEATAPEIVSGTAAGSHYLALSNGYIYCQSATWTASGTAAQAGFVSASVGGAIYAFSNSSSGTFTGARYSATLNGVVQSNGGGASYFPGNSAGTTSTGGQYV